MTTAEAAKLKGVHIQTILDAIERGDLNYTKFGRAYNVLDDEKFRAYTPARDPRERVKRRWQREKQDQAKQRKSAIARRTAKAKSDERAQEIKKRWKKFFALTRKLSPVIQAGRVEPIDLTALIDQMREERVRDVAGI
jgi:excisionase family DNA binding protein